MNKFFKPLAFIGLLLTILPALLLMTGNIDLALTKTLMIAGMVIWYATAIPWLGLGKG